MMPKLPQSTPVYTSLLCGEFEPYYTKDQMLAYGRAVAEACAVIAEESIASPFPVAAHVAIREAAKEIGK